MTQMTKDAFAARLAELHANPPAEAKWTDIFQLTDGSDPIPEDAQARLNAYFSKFATPGALGEERRCLGCQKKISGGLLSLFSDPESSSIFQWGLVHGEMSCGSCGWPARFLHYNIGGDPKDETVEPYIKSMSFLLLYHPSGISLAPEKAEEAEAK